MNRKLSVLIMLVIAFTLTACGSNKNKELVTESSNGNAGQIDASANNAFGTGYSKEALEGLGIVGDPLNYRTVYFEYNSSSIDERSSIIASAHARALASQNGTNVVLEGHADERGTRDYNLALGERRSQAVSDLMRTVGVGGNTIQTLSYGEERPVDPAHTDAAWQQNRRVQIVY